MHIDQYLLLIIQVDENMRRAHLRNAATEGKFFFRSRMDYVAEEDEEEIDSASPMDGSDGDNGNNSVRADREFRSLCNEDNQNPLEEMTVLEILSGKVGFQYRWTEYPPTVALPVFFLLFLQIIFSLSSRIHHRTRHHHRYLVP